MTVLATGGEDRHRDDGPPGHVHPRTAVLARALAAVLGTGAIALMVVSLLLWASQGFERLPASFARTPLAILPGQFAALCYTVVGALLAARLPRNPLGWLLLVTGLVISLILPITLLVAAAHDAYRPAEGTTAVAAWLLSSFGAPAMMGLVTVAGLAFPDGCFLSRRWQQVAWLTVLAVVCLGMAAALDPSRLLWYPTLPNPFAAPASLAPAIVALQLVGATLLSVSFAALVAALVVRYRMGDEVRRAQLRWIIYAALLLCAAVIPFLVGRYVAPVGEAVGEALVALVTTSLAALPIAAAFAVTRHRLFGIDRLISRTLVYVPLTGVLGGLYAFAVALFQRIFGDVAGRHSEVPVLIAIFLTAAAFTPVRQALEGAAGRWAKAPQSPPASADGGSGDRQPEEIREVAAAVIALRRFDERLRDGAGPDDAEAAGASRWHPVDGEARVGCPRGGSVPVSACLGCSQLRAIQTAPPRVACTALEPMT
jgi:hypothetical protein